MDIVYEALKKIPGMADNEAHEVAAKLSRSDSLVTQEYLDAAVAKLETRLTWRIFIAIGIAAAVTSAIIKLL